MTPKKSFLIRYLEPPDAAAMSALLSSQSAEYKSFFYAFGSDLETLEKILTEARQDVYAGVFWDDALIGFFMLRGWDEGYEYPSFGALISEEYRAQGIFPIIVASVKVICRLSGVNKFIAKSHPTNRGLKNLVNMGFRQVGVEESTGNTLWHVDL